MYKIFFHTFKIFEKKIGMIKESDLQTLDIYRTKTGENTPGIAKINKKI